MVIVDSRKFGTRKLLSLQIVGVEVLDTAGARGLLILPETEQNLTETLLARAAGTASGALTRNVDQLGDALPRGTTSGGILTAGQELVGLGTGLGLLLVDLVVVGTVKLVDILLRLRDGGGLLLCRNIGTTGELGVSLLTPQTKSIERGCQ